MQAVPFGIYCGRDTIRIFWRQLIDDGYRELTYLNTHIKVINELENTILYEAFIDLKGY